MLIENISDRKKGLMVKSGAYLKMVSVCGDWFILFHCLEPNEFSFIGIEDAVSSQGFIADTCI